MEGNAIVPSSFDVFTTVHSRSYEICELLGRSLLKFNLESNINLKCITDVDENPPVGWVKIGEVDGPIDGRNSAGIVIGMNNIESDYAIFCHSDTVMLYRNWDNVIIDLLERYKMVGVPQFNGLWMKYPSFIFCCAKSEDWIRMKISPYSRRNISSSIFQVATEEECGILGVQNGSTIKWDGGWEIPFKLNKFGYNYHVFTATISDLFFTDKRKTTEWAHNDSLFLAHFQAVRNRRRITEDWTKKVKSFLNNTEPKSGTMGISP
jgi:hypothetical protein